MTTQNRRVVIVELTLNEHTANLWGEGKLVERILTQRLQGGAFNNLIDNVHAREATQEEINLLYPQLGNPEIRG